MFRVMKKRLSWMVIGFVDDGWGAFVAVGAFPLLPLEEVGDCLSGGCCLCGIPDAAALA